MDSKNGDGSRLGHIAVQMADLDDRGQEHQRLPLYITINLKELRKLKVE